ncbi:MAG: FAD-dependent oxidoreductase, partial [Myxococcota bacterium]
RLQVDERQIRSRHVVLDVGARARIPSIPGLDSVPYLTNESVLALDTLPEHLVILGGSYISLEIGQIFRRFGSRVTVIEGGPRLAGREDAPVSDEIRSFLEEEGVEVWVESQVGLAAASARGGVELTLQDRTVLEGSHLLLAVGRVPNTDKLGLETIGLRTNARGFIETDGQFRTQVPGIVALGDVNGRGAFTHTAYQDGEIYIDALKGGTRSADDRISTYAMFTDPPLGRVGMTTREARASGRTVLKASYAMDAVTKAALDGERRGRIEVLVDADSHQILGATCLGLFGDEIVQIVSALMHAGAPYSVLQHMLPIHPTVAEFFPTILDGLAPLGPE